MRGVEGEGSVGQMEWRQRTEGRGEGSQTKGNKIKKNAIEKENPSKIKAFCGSGRGTAEVNEKEKKKWQAARVGGRECQGGRAARGLNTKRQE